ncbi:MULTISPECIES: porin family protein [Spirosoma]|uniref:PorT family protein n=1 Tax=Spirosoma liriopis TaxID=2937440 RepID=A0ABT0HEE2_9BACT|nr:MULTISPECIES: porin family protein [Spirosoma]MCK8490531.1 PorT family protein [Spirosoma liriopis]UHG89899.1 PorT family protein [Spirosoma oryzicola]
MKKNLLFAAFMLLPALTFAQGGFQIGIKGGVNLSKLSFGNFVRTGTTGTGQPTVGVDGQTFRDNLSASLDTRTGTSFGIYTRFGKNLFLQPELMYSTKAGSFDVVRNGATETVTVKTTSFDVPILLGIKGGPIRVMAGPIISFRIDDNQRLGEAIRQYTNGSLNDAWSQAYYGYQVGGGLDLGSFGLDVRYEGNLTDIAQIENSAGKFSQRLKSWQITLAYRLF